MKNCKIINIDIPVYNAVINVLLGNVETLKDSIKGIDGLYEELKNSINEFNQGKFLWSEKLNQWIIWLPRIPKTIQDMASLVHEIEHCVFYLFQYKGLKHSDDSEEAYAYMMEFLFQEIMTKVKE